MAEWFRRSAAGGIGRLVLMTDRYRFRGVRYNPFAKASFGNKQDEFPCFRIDIQKRTKALTETSVDNKEKSCNQMAKGVWKSPSPLNPFLSILPKSVNGKDEFGQHNPSSEARKPFLTEALKAWLTYHFQGESGTP